VLEVSETSAPDPWRPWYSFVLDEIVHRLDAVFGLIVMAKVIAPLPPTKTRRTLIKPPLTVR